jgi:hypothetical protein
MPKAEFAQLAGPNPDSLDEIENAKNRGDLGGSAEDLLRWIYLSPI